MDPKIRAMEEDFRFHKMLKSCFLISKIKILNKVKDWDCIKFYLN